MHIELSQHAYDVALLPIALQFVDGGVHVRLVAGGDDRLQARLLQFRIEHPQQFHLRRRVEVTALLATVGAPIVGVRLIERIQCLELHAILALEVFADLYEVVAELLVVLRLEVIRRGIGMTRRAAAVGHPVRGGVRERLEDSVRSRLVDFLQHLTLSRVLAPVIAGVGARLESVHLGPLTLSVAHVTVVVGRIIPSTDIVAENIIIQTILVRQELHQFIHLAIVPFAAHIRPPAEGDAPALQRLLLRGRIEAHRRHQVRVIFSQKPEILVLRQVDDRAMAHDRRERILAGIELREPSGRQIARHQREVPLSPEIVQQEAPFLLVIELEAGRTFNAREGAHVAADLRPIAQKRVGLLHDDIFTA